MKDCTQKPECIEYYCGSGEFRFRGAVAYGEYVNGTEYAVEHAPTQGDFDLVAYALNNNVNVEWM